MARNGEVFLILAASMFSLVTFTAAYDYFWMVEQWPPAICSRAGRRAPCTGPVPQRFTIHGLWPQLNSGRLLINCPGHAFDPTKVAAARRRLTKYWPDVERGRHQNFWGYEWGKHGTCSDPPFYQEKYFKKALNMRLKYHLKKILTDAGVKPDPHTQHSSTDVHHAIKSATGADAGLRCNNVQGGGRQLAEIVLCFKKKGRKLMNCPPSSTNCPAQFLWRP